MRSEGVPAFGQTTLLSSLALSATNSLGAGTPCLRS